LLFITLFLFSSDYLISLEKLERKGLFLSKEEAKQIKLGLRKYKFLKDSFEKIKGEVDLYISGGIEVPPPGEAGSYAHEKHKANGRIARDAGILYLITEERKYFEFVRQLLLEYSKIYPTLKTNPYAKGQAPGKLFHQMLNEAVWLVDVSIAYDCIYDKLNVQERDKIENDIFRSIVKLFTEQNKHEFDRVHNHGTWACAGVGMIGLVMNEKDWVQMALYGTRKDGKSGFLKQIDSLFSPDGYYVEGPYYARYALMPFYIFAEALHRNMPDLKIYSYRDSILKKALYSLLAVAYPNGVLPAINDASKTMDLRAPEIILAVNLAYLRYGNDEKLLGISAFQGRVLLHLGGLHIARDIAKWKGKSLPEWESCEFVDGHDGSKGGLAILRMKSENNETYVLMKYGAHGGEHGHFDKLSFILFDQNREILTDYGYCRWINIEPKFGGRYLPENKSYAMQTVAHNTVVVDEMSQNNADHNEAENSFCIRHFFDTKENVKVVSAKSSTLYPGVSMQRTIFMIKVDKVKYPIVVDLFRVSSESEHKYDYVLHYNGQIILTNFPFEKSALLEPIGRNYGYQHIWKEGSGKTSESISFTWLDGERYYTSVINAYPETEVIFGRIGANDPNFNLRSEPVFMVRRVAKTHLFVNAIQPHGYFNEAREISVDPYGNIKNVKVIGDGDAASVVIIEGDKFDIKIIVNNGKSVAPDKELTVNYNGNIFSWKGNYFVDIKNKK
jgi:hypothetical protein